jgi:transcriptional regulator of arginine metabolism
VTNKAQRQHRIERLLSDETVTNQGQLVDSLAADGIEATQATVSRDLDELGAVKIRTGGGETIYAIPELPHHHMIPEDHMRRVLSDWVADVNYSANLVVLRTPPGSAHVVASALDRTGISDVIGTVAGDDTIMVIVADGVPASQVADKLKDLAGL